MDIPDEYIAMCARFNLIQSNRIFKNGDWVAYRWWSSQDDYECDKECPMESLEDENGSEWELKLVSYHGADLAEKDKSGIKSQLCVWEGYMPVMEIVWLPRLDQIMKMVSDVDLVNITADIIPWANGTEYKNLLSKRLMEQLWLIYIIEKQIMVTVDGVKEKEEPENAYDPYDDFVKKHAA